MTLKVSDIEGLPNITFGIPIGKEAATSLLEEGAKVLNKVETFDLEAMRRMAHDDPH